MSQNARVLVIGDEVDEHGGLSRRLRSCGYDIQAADIGGDLPFSENMPPDVVIINLMAGEYQDRKALLDYAGKVNEGGSGSRASVILIGSGVEAHEAASSAQVDDIISGPVNDLQICGRINSYLRLNTMQSELNRRLATANMYGIDAPDRLKTPGHITDAKVLVVGPTPLYAHIENALSKNATLTGALTPAAGLDYMQHTRFDAVLADTMDDPETAINFAGDVRRNSDLFNTPIILMAETDQMGSLDRAFSNGVTDILSKPLDAGDLNARIISLVRETRFRASLKTIYEHARNLATNDSLTGLYSRGFLLTHMQALLRDCQLQGHVCTVAFFRIGNISAINAAHGHVTGDRIIRQVGEAMSLLIRGEDLAARYSGPEFAILLPDTPVESGMIPIRRIRSVINCTEFLLPELSVPVHAELECGLAGYKHSESPEAMISRARKRCA